MILKSTDKNNLDFIKNFDLFYTSKNIKNLNNLKKSFRNLKNKYLDQNDYFLIIENFENNKVKLQRKVKLFEKFSTLLETK